MKDTNIETIKENLLNKSEISTYTDNEETEVLVDTYYNFIKPVSITDNLDDTYTVVLSQANELEQRIELLESAFNEMLFSEEVAEDASISEETNKDGENN